MFRHVVMMAWNHEATDEQKEAARAALSRLPDQIAEILSYRTGADAGINDGNYHFVIVAEFADQDAYLRYARHPVHQQVIAEHVRPILSRRAAVQHEWSEDERA